MVSVGDRVTVNESTDDYWRIVGQVGTVIRIDPNAYTTRVLIEFDEYIGGHDGSGFIGTPLGEYGHCWWVESCVVELVDSTKNPTLTIKEKIHKRCEHIYSFQT